MLVEPAEIHFRARARRDRADHFGAIDDEPMHEKRKMAIFASLNPNISSGGQPTQTKFNTSIEAQSAHLAPKAR